MGDIPRRTVRGLCNKRTRGDTKTSVIKKRDLTVRKKKMYPLKTNRKVRHDPTMEQKVVSLSGEETRGLVHTYEENIVSKPMR